MFCRHYTYFNPLIPRKEIQQYCTKICCRILAVLPKIHLLFLSTASKLSNFQELTEKSDSYSGANPPHFSCELPVRTMIIFTTHNHLLPSYCITSFVYHTFTVPNRLNTFSIKYTVANICKICLEESVI